MKQQGVHDADRQPISSTMQICDKINEKEHIRLLQRHIYHHDSNVNMFIMLSS